MPRGCRRPDCELLPELDPFYAERLGRPLADRKEFADKTLDVVGGWSTR